MAKKSGGSRDLAPAPMFPEKPDYTYETQFAPNRPGGRGPLRFEEGLATDTDLPNNFMIGMVVPQGSGNVPDASIQYKSAQETMSERAHVGSAAWVEAPTWLSEYAQGANEPPVTYISVTNPQGRVPRPNHARVQD